MDGERRAGAVCPPAVLRVELTERLNQKEAAVTLDLRAETPGDQRLNQKEAAVTLDLRAETPGDQRLNQKEAAVTLDLRADTW